MALKDIEKLKEKVEKDPNSKLFVPLAEEYRKEGMLDDAIGVLLGGLERQPAYMSARVSLGKIYMEKGMMKEARAEFENVIKSIPDNLYAQKKLAEIYREAGEKNLAIKAYRNVLKLNPMDEEVLSSLREIEGEELEPEVAGEMGSPPPGLESTSFAGEAAAEVVEEETGSQDESLEEVPAESSDDDLHSFRDSLFGVEGGQADLPEESITEETISEDEEEVLIDEEEVLMDEGSGGDDEILFGDFEDEAEEEESVSWDISEESVTEEVLPEMNEETVPPVPDMDEISPGRDSLSDADGMISKGDFSGALRIYRRILASDPDDRGTLQRIEELRSLLKLMGRDKEALISDLNDFLEAIKKGRDVFFRSS